MLRRTPAALVHLHRPLNHHLRATCLAFASPACRRSFMSTDILRDAPNSATSAAHKRNPTHETISTAAALTQPGAVSTVPTMVRGDWVLFHPVYTQEELKAVEVRRSFHHTLPSCFLTFSKVLHREAKTVSDKLAYGLVRLARRIFDLVSGYKHVQIAPDEKMTVQQLRKAGYLLDDRQWLNVRFILKKCSLIFSPS